MDGEEKRTDMKHYTVNEVAEICKVTPYTVRAWLKSGKLRGTKISPKAWRVPKESLQEFLEIKHG